MSKRQSKKKNSALGATEPSGRRHVPPTARPAGPFAGRNLALVCAGLFLVVFLAFFPALKNDFVSYDDQDYVTGNPHVKAGLTVAGVAWAFTTGHASNWHPLTWISHMLDCQVFGMKAWGHHLTSVFLHALNGMLLFLVLRRMTGANWKSLAVALLFGLHPLRVESVAWVAERKDVLSTAFWLLTMLAYAWYVELSKAGDSRFKSAYVLAIGLFACGLMSKPMLVTLPCALLLFDYWPLRRISGWRFVLRERKTEGSPAGILFEKIPFLVLALVSCIVTMLVQRGSMAEHFSLPVQLGNAVVAYSRYLGKLIWPANLAVIYPHPGQWPVGVLLVCGLILLTLSVLAFMLRQERPWFAVGWLWFLGTLIPTIGIIQVGSQSIADRYTYIPCIGIFIILAWAAEQLTRKWPVRKLLPAAAAAGVIACIAVTEVQIGAWRNNETLCRHAVAVTDDNYIAINNLGVSLADSGRPDEAIKEYQESLRIKPKYAPAMMNLGVQMTRLRRLDEAVALFRATLAITPGSAEAHNDLGSTLTDQGKLDEAIVNFQQAIRLRPDYPKAHYNWGLARARQSRWNDAIAQYQEALRLDPEYFDARNNLGVVYYEQGRFDEAIAAFQAALLLKPNDPKTIENIQIAREDKVAAQKSRNPAGRNP